MARGQSAADVKPEGATTYSGSLDHVSATEAAGIKTSDADPSDGSKSASDLETRFLRIEEQNKALVAQQTQLLSLLNQFLEANPDGEDDPEPTPEPVGRSLRDLKPKEGYDAADEFHDALIAANEELRQRLERAETLLQQNLASKPQDEWRRWQRDNKGWEEYDEDMGRIAKSLGIRPATAEQFDNLLELARAKKNTVSLSAEVDRLSKSGPVPNLAPPSGNVSRILAGNGNQRRGPNNWQSALSQAMDRAATKIVP